MKMLVPAVDAPTAVRLRVAGKTPAAGGVLTLTLEHPEGRRLPSWSPGAHPDLVPGNGMTRQFPLGGDRSGAFRYRAGVLREPAGRGGSAYIHGPRLRGPVPGTTIAPTAPQRRRVTGRPAP